MFYKKGDIWKDFSSQKDSLHMKLTTLTLLEAKKQDAIFIL
jgi:hypothetical protein